MTGREQLKIEFRRGWTFILTGLVGMVVTRIVAYALDVEDSRPLALPGFFVLAFGGLYLYWWSRCGACQNSLGMFALSHETRYGWKESSVRFCPFCGTDLDAEEFPTE